MNGTSAKLRVIEYYNQEADRYHELYSKELLDQEFYPANAIRLQLILDRLNGGDAKTLLDVGCGSGGPLLTFLESGLDASGFDFSPRMVEHGQELLRAKGQDPTRCFQADLERRDTLPARAFDAVVATGVFPHNLDDDAAYANLRELLAPHGVAFVEYRNALMSLFSVNKYSVDFYWEQLLQADRLPEELREATRQFVAMKFDTPVANVGRARDIDYSSILARFHNPLTLGTEVSAHGLQLETIHYYHWHAAPPHLERPHRKTFWDESLHLEGKNDWRAMFMCSAFVAEFRRSESTQ
jgi:SAM-dependent methyltransferase